MKRFLSLAAAVLLCLMILPLCSIDASAVHNFAKGWNGEYYERRAQEGELLAEVL